MAREGYLDDDAGGNKVKACLAVNQPLIMCCEVYFLAPLSSDGTAEPMGNARRNSGLEEILARLAHLGQEVLFLALEYVQSGGVQLLIEVVVGIAERLAHVLHRLG